MSVCVCVCVCVCVLARVLFTAFFHVLYTVHFAVQVCLRTMKIMRGTDKGKLKCGGRKVFRCLSVSWCLGVLAYIYFLVRVKNANLNAGDEQV